MKIYVSGKNLATWTGWHGWDPEHASGGELQEWPIDKIMGFGTFRSVYNLKT